MLAGLERSFFVKPNRLKRMSDRLAGNLFHFLYYHSPDTYQRNTFLGYRVMQCPMDLYLYQELIHRVRPSFVLETGIGGGGSLLNFATLLDLIGAPEGALVVGVDIRLSDEARTLRHRRIRMVEGSSTDLETLEQVRRLLPRTGGLVVLDSDHAKEHVLQELSLYRSFVDVGGYLVVEDTNINGHPVKPLWGAGPNEAVKYFLARNPEFRPDDELWRRNKFSFHRWLRRVQDDREVLAFQEGKWYDSAPGSGGPSGLSGSGLHEGRLGLQ
jgi:cephalosporin hydroxylase